MLFNDNFFKYTSYSIIHDVIFLIYIFSVYYYKNLLLGLV